MRIPSKFDFDAEVMLYTHDNGGRTQPPTEGRFKCPLIINNELFDCGMFFKERLALGIKHKVQIILFSPEIVIPMLKVGYEFGIWEMKKIGFGIVENIYRDV